MTPIAQLEDGTEIPFNGNVHTSQAGSKETGWSSIWVNDDDAVRALSPLNNKKGVKALIPDEHGNVNRSDTRTTTLDPQRTIIIRRSK